ncbi:MAG: thiamine pyrophosphate-dependent dehydrogenase E1 component subunit alpha [Acidimicrobiia bacterium]|nr:thiamine pyrophosphate-dependent dehydrogenase E1 component subunit alpha [Acidimicrobiia bacterium]
MSMWKQGRGVGGTFSGRGHEAIAVGAGYALGPDDVVAPMHRDLGCYLVRGMSPERILANQLGKEMGVTAGRDANLHGLGDLSLNIIGFVSHLPQSMPAALGAAMAFQYRQEPRVALTFVGDGSSNTGLFHETLNLAAVQQAPFVVVVENNQYAYSTPLEQQMAIEDIVVRAEAHGVPGEIVDGNNVAEIFTAVSAAADRARHGEGPSLIEAKTMRMLGHAIHDGAEYVPSELLAEWEKRDPVATWEARLVEEGLLNEEMLERLHEECREEVEMAIEQAEKAALPDPHRVETGVYAP